MSQDISLDKRELVSALADGQLPEDELAGVLASMASSDEGLVAWHSYHLVGDVLRCRDLADCRRDMAFLARLRGRLPSAIDARPSPEQVAEAGLMSTRPSSHTAIPRTSLPHSANDSVTRWKLAAGMASMVALAAIGWHIASVDARVGTSAHLAAAPASNAAAVAAQAGSAGSMAEPPVMLRDARLDELLAAHKQFGGTSALQMPAGFLRNATFENPGR